MDGRFRSKQLVVHGGGRHAERSHEAHAWPDSPNDEDFETLLGQERYREQPQEL